MSAFTTKEDSDILTLYGQVCEGNDTTCKNRNKQNSEYRGSNKKNFYV